jgi:hypothetical protein
MARDLAGARVVLLYGPGNVAIDCAGGLWRGIERGLLDLGAEVATLNLSYFKAAIRGGDAPYPDDSPLVRGMIDFLHAQWPGQKIDLCFGLFHDVYLTAGLQAALRERCAKVVNYPLNLLDQPHRFVESLRFCDETFCSEEDALAPARAVAGSDAKVRYVPMAADPWIFRPTGEAPSPRLLFVGSAYADRAWLLDRCAEVLPVSMYGQGHDLRGIARGLGRELLRRGRLTPPVQAARMLRRAAARTPLHVSDEEYVRLAATHGVSVGFSEVVQERTGRLLRKVRLREYEATMAGLCHLAWPLPELQRGFEGGKELLFYESEEQITDLLAQIKGGAIDFRAVGRAARARAERDHTWTVRLRAALCG